MNRDLLGVASWGLGYCQLQGKDACEGCRYLWSMCRLDDMSAARLAVGDDPLMGCMVK